jgi:CRISPR-associated protein Cas1
MGFDPYLGFYHQIDYGRPSLALDLLEEFRAPLVDRLALSVFNRKIFQAKDFTESPEQGSRLHRESLKRFFPLYEEELTKPFPVDGDTLTFRQIFRRQAERLARTLIEGEPYQGFRLPC